MLSRCVLDFSVGVNAFVLGLSLTQIYLPVSLVTELDLTPVSNLLKHSRRY